MCAPPPHLVRQMTCEVASQGEPPSPQGERGTWEHSHHFPLPVMAEPCFAWTGEGEGEGEEAIARFQSQLWQPTLVEIERLTA